MKQQRCLNPDCQNDAKTRGLCSVCYQGALSAVRRKETTWEELSELGLANPSTGGGQSRLMKALFAARAKKNPKAE